MVEFDFNTEIGGLKLEVEVEVEEGERKTYEHPGLPNYVTYMAVKCGGVYIEHDFMTYSGRSFFSILEEEALEQADDYIAASREKNDE